MSLKSRGAAISGVRVRHKGERPDANWQVCATGIDFDTADSSKRAGPSLDQINVEIGHCNAGAGDPATTSAGWVNAAGALTAGALGRLAVGQDSRAPELRRAAAGSAAEADLAAEGWAGRARSVTITKISWRYSPDFGASTGPGAIALSSSLDFCVSQICFTQ